MLHAFISGNISFDENCRGTVGWAFVLARDFGDIKGPFGEDYIIETACSGSTKGTHPGQGSSLAYRMASRVASTQTHDAGDGNQEDMAVHFDVHGREHMDALPPDGQDMFHDGITILPGTGENAWPHDGKPWALARRMARRAAAR